ncbi:MAG: hypothetical protein AB8C84_01755 [Oligoflexales bacterium]
MKKEEALASLPHGIRGIAVYQQQSPTVFWIFTLMILFIVLAFYYFVFKKYSQIKPLTIERAAYAKKSIVSIHDFSSVSSIQSLSLEFRRIVFLTTDIPSLELTYEQLILELEKYFDQPSILKIGDFFKWSEKILFADMAIKSIEVETWKKEILFWVDHLLKISEENN